MTIVRTLWQSCDCGVQGAAEAVRAEAAAARATSCFTAVTFHTVR